MHRTPIDKRMHAQEHAWTYIPVLGAVRFNSIGPRSPVSQRPMDPSSHGPSGHEQCASEEATRRDAHCLRKNNRQNIPSNNTFTNRAGLRWGGVGSGVGRSGCRGGWERENPWLSIGVRWGPDMTVYSTIEVHARESLGPRYDGIRYDRGTCAGVAGAQI